MPSFGEVKLVAMALVILGLVFGAVHVTRKVDAVKYQKLELAYQAAQAKAVAEAMAQQREFDDLASKAARDDARKQAAVVANVKQQLAEVKRHVHAISATGHCITYGLVRVIDAAVHGVSASDLPLPAGKSDDACAPVSAADLARSIVDNYGTARANASQLDDLEAFSRAAKAAHDRAKAAHSR